MPLKRHRSVSAPAYRTLQFTSEISKKNNPTTSKRISQESNIQGTFAENTCRCPCLSCRRNQIDVGKVYTASYTKALIRTSSQSFFIVLTEPSAMLSRHALVFAVVSTLIVTALADHLRASENPGELSPALLKELRDSYKPDNQTRLLHNAVTNNEIKDLALNRGILRGHNTHFSHKIEFKANTDQCSSGRCWIFAGLNTMRPQVIRERQLADFEFSSAYLQFWDKMEKANLYLEQMIALRDADYLSREWQLVNKWSLSDGGWWNYVVGLIDKYGVVPSDVMPETHSSSNTRTMNRILERKLRADAARLHKLHKQGGSVDDLRKLKQQAMKEVYRFLAINLGEPPTEFEWRYEIKKDATQTGKEPLSEFVPTTDADFSSTRTQLSPLVQYTPKSFYKKFVGVDLRDFVCIYHDPNNAAYKHYQFKDARNMVGIDDMHFVNAPIDVLKQAAMKSILANQPLWFAADVGKDQSTKHGIMANRLYEYDTLFGQNHKMTKAERVRYGLGGSNHAMVFMGVDIRNGKPVKWLVENSWGDDKGDQGKWTLYDDWFDEHVYTLIVDKRFLSKKVMKVFEEKAKVLPPWYPGAAGIDAND